jgi:Protein of unknown function (DUF4197)
MLISVSILTHCVAAMAGSRFVAMKNTKRLLSVAALILALSVAGVTMAATALDLLTQKDAVAGLKEVLSRGAASAISKLGVADGFLGNPEVKIPLPGKLAKAEKTLKMLGLGPKADQLVQTMNRAAEAAVPEAKTLFVDAIKGMSVQDAKGILTGGDDAGTQYFRRAMQDKLTAKFLPVIKQSTDKLQVANQYNSLAGQASKLGLVDAKDATVESYVTGKALDGLFLMMAKEELAVRKDPVGTASKLLQKVFGALKR